MDNLKQIEDLKEGECKVITKQGKVFHGYFRESLNCVFFAIPSTYEIIGYIQEV
jgi:hypothetical protein